MAAPTGPAGGDNEQGTLFVPEPGSEPIDGQAAAPAEPEPAPEPPPIDRSEYERLETERNEMAARLAAEQDRVNRLLSQPPAQAPSPPPASEPMPDPAADPEAFQRWYAADAARRESAIRQEVEQRSTAMSTENRATAEWQRFCTDNPHLADLESYARAEFLELTSGTGVLPTDTSAFRAALKDRLEKKCNRRPQSPPARTGHVSAGSEPRPKPAPPTPQEDDGDATFVDQIKDWQAKSGLYGS